MISSGVHNSKDLSKPGSGKEQQKPDEKKEESKPTRNSPWTPSKPLTPTEYVLGAAIWGAAIIGASYYFGGGCSTSKKAPELTQRSDVASLVVPPRAKQFATAQEAMDGVRAGTFLPVEELSSVGSEASVLLFKNTQSGEVVVLKNTLLGAERAKFLSELQTLGHAIPVSLSSTGSNPAPPTVSAPSTPWYSSTTLAVSLASLATLGWLASKAGAASGLGLGNDPTTAGEWITERPSVRLNSYGGNQGVLAWGQKVVRDIQAVMRGDPAPKLPRGIILGGFPGVGKSFLMQCVAGEAGCPIIITAAASLCAGSYVGSRIRAINGLFAAARTARDEATRELRAKPSATGNEQAVVLVVIDELDSIARTRSVMPDWLSRENNDAVNSLLAQMDGPVAEQNHNIILLGATNFLDQIDPALRRPGRFSEQMDIAPPRTPKETVDVFQKLLPAVCAENGCEPPTEESLRRLALSLRQITPATCRGILEEAACATKKGERISPEALFSAYQTVMCGPVSENSHSIERRALLAAHELGHALIGYAFGAPPTIISMKPRGNSLGRVVLAEASLHEQPPVKNDLIRLLMIAAAGRAGELLSSGGQGEPSEGVSGDFEGISDLARRLLDSGMLSGSYAINFRARHQTELPPERQRLVEAVGVAAVQSSVTILKSLPAGTFDRISNDAIDKEFFGDKATSYVEKSLTGDELAKLRDTAAQALEKFPALVRTYLEGQRVEERGL